MDNLQSVSKFIKSLPWMELSKILVIYITILSIFYFVDNHWYRFICLIILSCICVSIFSVPRNQIILFIIIAISCTITEMIFVTFLNNTWQYQKSDIFNIPFWLSTLWFIAIIFINEINKIIK
jgi:hypothetical protein